MYYVYYNWSANPGVGKIHIGECGNCNQGLGKHRNVVQGRNGRWEGPFANIIEAENSILANGWVVSYDRCINV